MPPDRPPSPSPGIAEVLQELDLDDDLDGDAYAAPRHDVPPDEDCAMKEEIHPLLDGTPCNAIGEDLPPDSPPSPHDTADHNADWYPYESRAEFEFADFLYKDEQMSGGKIKRLCQILAALYPDRDPNFADDKDLYATIDATTAGDIPWDSFSVTYNGPRPTTGEIPLWMLQTYQVWHRNILKVTEGQIGNPEFNGGQDFAARHVFKGGKRQYCNMMSGDFAWEQSDIIAQDPMTHGAMFEPIVLGSDKTTVSVATGQHDFYPLYSSPGSIHNNIRRAQRGGVALVAFLATPKTTREYQDDPNFRKFRRQLFHASLRHILLPLRPYMTTPRVTRCSDGHFRRIIYGIGPYIADYPEQALLACIVQNWCARCTAKPDALDGNGGRRSHVHTDAILEAFDLHEAWDAYGIVGELIPFTADFPRADIHQLIAPDLLHQIIKGTFHDHLVMWVVEYIEKKHGKTEGAKILADIDRRIAAAPSFPGLRRFPDGRNFKQWTGDDAKALMKVYLPAVSGHLPSQMVRALSAFLEFCYLVRRSVIDEHTLDKIDDALRRYHAERVIFEKEDIRTAEGLSPPRQHSMVHYRYLIEQFGAPNGICSSITESKHIKAVKEPYRRSNRYEALGQMLLTNQRLSKLAAARTEFAARGMLDGPLLPSHLADMLEELRGAEADSARGIASKEDATRIEEEDDDADAVEGPRYLGEVRLARCPTRGTTRDVHLVGLQVGQPLCELVRRFLYDQHHPDAEISGSDIDLIECPPFSGRIFTYPSAIATFFAPSNMSGSGGMYRERIRAVSSWRKGPARYDCVFISEDVETDGFRGLHAARVRSFFRAMDKDKTYPCALVQWFVPVGDQPDDETGMWIVERDMRNGEWFTSVVHIDCILRGAHLIGVAGNESLPTNFKHTESLDLFRAFYVNKYADYHSHEIAF